MPGHQDVVVNNTCVIWQPGVAGRATDADMVLTQNDCGACSKDRSATPKFGDSRSVPGEQRKKKILFRKSRQSRLKLQQEHH